MRATVLEMNPDGTARRYVARGLRNAVGLRWVGGRLYATNMGADHLGPHRPADTMYAVEAGANYGWPYCYQSGQKVLADGKYNPRGSKFNCRRVPAAYAAFDAHSSPLGLEYFDQAYGPELGGSFLVALHGPTKGGPPHGHRVARVRAGGGPASVEDFITGFKRAGKINGRPCDLLRFGRGGFLLTDDHAGVVYYVYQK